MDEVHVYDKAKYHQETIEEYGLPEKHSANHTVVFLRWLIENDLVNESFIKDSGGTLKEFRAGRGSIYVVYEWWDNCLSDDMLSDEGNGFARHYFEFATGAYLQDYAETLRGALPSEVHIAYTEANYQRMKLVIDRRFKEWREGKSTARVTTRVTTKESDKKESESKAGNARVGNTASGSEGKPPKKRWWQF